LHATLYVVDDEPETRGLNNSPRTAERGGFGLVKKDGLVRRWFEEMATSRGGHAMDGSIPLSSADHKAYLHLVHHDNDERRARRSDVLLLLGKGWSVPRIAETVFALANLVCAVRRRFLRGGRETVLEPESTPIRTVASWHRLMQRWLLAKTPQDFGHLRVGRVRSSRN
jgi:hypothetical protein